MQVTETGHAGALPPRVLADYALFADRAIPAGAAPANYALFADAGLPTEAAPPQHALSVEKQAIASEAQRRRAPYRAIAAAFALHLAVLMSFFVWPGSHKRLGVEDGSTEPLAVSVISSADLKRLSSDPFLQDAFPSPAPAEENGPAPEPAPAVPPPAQPAQQETKAAATDHQSKSKPNETREAQETAFDPTGYIEMASAQFSAQLNNAFKAAEARRETQQRSAAAHQPAQAAPNVKVFRPGATHIGKSDEFARAVIWALAATRPMGNGKWGTSIVTFLVSADGRVDGLRLLKSADDNWLDTGALMAVKQARMPVPPPGLPAGDRTFNVQYISIPGG